MSKVTRGRKLKARVTSPEKSRGQTYTPTALARFMAERLVAQFAGSISRPPASLRVLDPAVGEGALLAATATVLRARWPDTELVLIGVDVDAEALDTARERCSPYGEMVLVCGDFLECYQDDVCRADLIVANPPYVRVQSLSSRQLGRLVKRFGLEGHKDLSHAFMLAILEVWQRVAGAMVVSVVPNSILLTAAAATIRQRLLAHTRQLELWDLGDTRLFDAAVLPLVMLWGKPDESTADPAPDAAYYSIYTTREEAAEPLYRESPLVACRTFLDEPRVERAWSQAPGTHKVFELLRGKLIVSEPDGSWVLRRTRQQVLLDAVAQRCWKRFDEVGRIRVGVKSCADAVFLKEDWSGTQVEQKLLRPLMTHQVARAFKAHTITRQILYPHEVDEVGKRHLIDGLGTIDGQLSS